MISSDRNSRFFFELAVGQAEVANEIGRLYEVVHTSAPRRSLGVLQLATSSDPHVWANVATGIELCNTEPSIELERSPVLIIRLCESV